MQIHSNHPINYLVPLNTKDGICIDIGGNMGQFTLLYHKHFSKMHVYEPQTECYEIIKKNCEGLTNITIFDEAVFHTSNLQVDLISHSTFDSGSVAVKTDIIQIKEWKEDIIVDSKCKTISLADIIERAGGYVDYMKIDCENSEYYLLMNNDLSKIKYIGMELHHQMGKDNFDNLVNHILKYFNNPLNTLLEHGYGNNIEVLFESKYITDKLI